MPATPLHSAAMEVLRRAKGADLSSLNEANTKALLIEPMLVALGWDVLDLDAVTREYSVYDGTLLDYALLVAKRPALFCEAKPTRRSLDDPKWVAQTINYANNEGVVWCVLTDGLRWRVFKANEATPMEKKLAFEVHVADLFDDQGCARAERLFSCLTPSAVADGELARLGTQVFVDGRVQATLVQLLEDPPAKLVDLLRSHMGTEHGLKPADVRGALARVVGPAVEALEKAPYPVPAQSVNGSLDTTLTSSADGPAQPSGEGTAPREISYAERLVRWPTTKALHDALLSQLTGKVKVTERRLHLALHAGDTYIGGVEAQKSGLMVRVPLNMDSSTAAAPLLAGRLVDVTGKGRWARGVTEVLIADSTDVPHAVALLLASAT